MVFITHHYFKWPTRNFLGQMKMKPHLKLKKKVVAFKIN